MASYELTCPSSASFDSDADVHAKTDDNMVAQIRLTSPDKDELKYDADSWFKVPIKHKEGVNLKVTFENSQGYVAETKYCHIDVT